ncbi:MAG: hypothetical protein U1C70_12060 [Sediminibacterium sp.]|uniref:hypothetical protein n=1 Tax=Sediminibacterium sp. TaxID=1917865 RepID=UPI002ABA2159|nr:hypothetical protein [Sediminibacterium sp.]MDZ4072552.1 hypothetical protein [Sediminibacterium sp.]
MQIIKTSVTRIVCLLIITMAACIPSKAQTEIDGIMMAKNNYCSGIMYNYSSWDQYWEGTLKRNNLNLGTVSTSMIAYMGNYGISDKLNVLFGLPYIKTKASAGTLHGMQGLQDLSLWVKWMPYEKEFGKSTLSFYAIGGVSVPVSDYTPDLLPLSIGLRSKTLSLRAMADYQIGSWFATASATYVVRDKVTLDRESYYTTQLHNTNEVSMPDASTVNIRAGYRTGRLIAEAVWNKWTTLGGFDITRNNMPFVSNRMNASMLGINMKYNLKKIEGLSLIANGNITLSGRNMGQASTLGGGAFYVIDFSSKKKKEKTSSTDKK